MLHTAKNKIFIYILLFIICLNCFVPLGMFYPIILVLFLLYYAHNKYWTEVVLCITFLLFTFIHLAFIVLIIAALFVPIFRKTFNWLKLGKQSKTSIFLIIITSIISVVALLIWAHWTNNLGIAIIFVQNFTSYNQILVIAVLIPIFALVNSFIEEFAFRGILQESLGNIFNSKTTVIILQAVPFAAFHYAVGFPNGIIGFIMVFIWGSVLGYLRETTKGMAAPVICHIFADMTIFYYLFYYVLH
ncbi:MAG TPA: type II CAAX endopeptidase family protein [Victivallales bacterium]|nr:type II CAAX endopeptidase family protein [Victivallales bacterium]